MGWITSRNGEASVTSFGSRVPAGGSLNHEGRFSSASHVTCTACTSGDSVIANRTAFSVAAFHRSTGTSTIGGASSRASATLPVNAVSTATSS